MSRVRTSITVACGLATVLAAGPTAAQTCGNFVRETPEQCDDGNVRNLDGCDGGCRFEHTQRINNLQMQFATAPECTANRLGEAFSSAQARGLVQNSIAAGYASTLFHLLGLDDPAAVDDASLEVGLLAAVPILPGSTVYNENTSADWWYAVDDSGLDGDRLPTDRLAGTVAGNVLTAGPGPARMPLALGDADAELKFSSLRIAVTTGAVSTPPASAGLAPGREAIEHLDTALQTFASGAQPSNPNWGTLCGNISAASLAQIPIPVLLTSSFPCDQAYTEANSFLDLLVSGCDVVFIPHVVSRHPDQSDPAAPQLGAGPPYRLSANAQRVVSTCRDRDFTVVDLAACLNAAAYSAFFRFTTHRVLAADDLVFDDGFESGTLAAWSAASTDGGDLAVSAAAPIVGAFSLVGIVNDTTGLFVQDDEPEDESRFRARFHFDPSGFDPGEASNRFRTRILIGFEENPTRRVLAVVLRRQGGNYSLMVRARQDDNSQVNTSFFPISAGPHRVELEWVRSSGASANDGVLRVWLDGSLAQTLTGLDNSLSSVDFTRLGALSVKAGASGTLKWDDYQARRRAPAVP